MMRIKNRFFMVLVSLFFILFKGAFFETVVCVSHRLSIDEQKALNKSLFIATVRNDKEKFEEALKRGAQINCKDHIGRTILHFAASLGHLEIMIIALHAGGDVNALNQWRSTPLHRAVTYERKEAVQMLLAAGTDQEIKDTGHRIARDLASTRMRKVIDETVLKIEKMKLPVREQVIARLKNIRNDLSGFPDVLINDFVLKYLEEDIEERVRDGIRDARDAFIAQIVENY